MENPLVDDRLIDFLLTEVHDARELTTWPAFEGHGEDTFALFLGTARRIARERLFPSYRAMDECPPRFEGGRITTHPDLPAIYRDLVELGCIAATRPMHAGGQGLPQLVYSLGSAYLMAGNLGAYCYAGLTAGAAHLIEAFGDETLDRAYRQPMLEGRFTGTMALTEPQAGSSLGDVTTRATPMPDGSHRIKGSKIFISGGDNTVVENTVHLLLARIDGAPSGTKGISLFCVPNRRFEGDSLVDNDVTVAGMIHKIGWKALPSLALEFGDRDDCHGYLVGEPNQGLRQMFQMMNEARLMVGMNAAATASVAYHESKAYAFVRTQGRRGRPDGPQVPIVEHADVRRMLLRQKAIVEGAFSLLARTARLADVAEHHPDEDERRRAKLLVDLLTPIAKSFPAEFGFESNALAVQIHGGYGYSSEYLPESWMRDQKLNSIHEGTTGIQALDLLGRKVTAAGGEAMRILGAAMIATSAEARAAGVEPEDCDAFEAAVTRIGALTSTLAARGARGDADGMLSHATDYLTLASIVVVAWHWLELRARVARRGDVGESERRFAVGLHAAGRYWVRTELPRVEVLARLCEDAEDSYLKMPADAF